VAGRDVRPRHRGALLEQAVAANLPLCARLLAGQPGWAEHGERALWVAVRGERWACARWLLRAGARGAHRCRDGTTALHQAVRAAPSRAQLAVLRALAQSSHTQALPIRSPNPLCAARSDRSLRVLLAHASPVALRRWAAQPGPDGMVPLEQAAARDSAGAYRALLGLCRGRVRQSVAAACSYGADGVVAYLGASHPELLRGSVGGQSPVHVAARADNVPALRTIVAVHGAAELLRADTTGKLPIHCAAQGGAVRAVHYLVERGPASSVGATETRSGQGVLRIAVASQLVTDDAAEKVVAHLLASGRVAQPDMEQALCVAAQRGYRQTATRLLPLVSHWVESCCAALVGGHAATVALIAESPQVGRLRDEEELSRLVTHLTIYDRGDGLARLLPRLPQLAAPVMHGAALLGHFDMLATLHAYGALGPDEAAQILRWVQGEGARAAVYAATMGERLYWDMGIDCIHELTDHGHQFRREYRRRATAGCRQRLAFARAASSGPLCDDLVEAVGLLTPRLAPMGLRDQ
jgi:ankyrin repeat protein